MTVEHSVEKDAPRRRLMRWAGEWIETWRVAPPFSRRRRELLAAIADTHWLDDAVEVERPSRIPPGGSDADADSDAAAIVAVLADHRMVQYTGQGSVLCACVDQHSIQWSLSEYRTHVAAALVAAGIGVIADAQTRDLPPEVSA